MKKSLLTSAVMVFCIMLFIGCGQPSPTTSVSTPTSTTPVPSSTLSPTMSPTTTPTQSKPTSVTPTPSPTTTPDQPRYGGKFIGSASSSPSRPFGVPWEMNPPAHGAAIPVLQMLVVEDSIPGSGQVHPMLATSWDINIDASPPNIVLYLRKGVKFHDGTDWNAQAAKWNIDKWIEAKQSYSTSFESVDQIDEYTIRINLSHYENTVMNVALAGWNSQMISPTSFEENGIEWARYNPVGTGPFTFVSFERDVSLKYKRFDNYWKEGKPYLDELEILIITDPLTKLMAFKAGTIYYVPGRGDKTAADLRDEGYITITQDIALAGSDTLIPDSGNPDSPLANKEVRYAIEYAIDKEAIAQGVGLGFMEPAYQLSPTANKFVYIPGLDERKYNPTKAKQLLEQAGFSDGFTMTITPDPFTTNRDVVVAIKSYLAKVGIQAELNFVEYGAYTDYRYNGWENGCLIHKTGVGANGVSGYQSAWGGTSFPSLKYTEGFLDAIMQSLLTTLPTQENVQEVNRIAFDDAMVIPIATSSAQYFVAKGAHIGNTDFGLGQYNHFQEDFWVEEIVTPK